MRQALSVVLSLSMLGCATTVPYTGQGPHPQLSRGRPLIVIDTIANVLISPMKLLLWNRRFGSHAFSPEHETTLAEYLASRQLAMFRDARFHINEYDPATDVRRLIHNSHVAWPYRVLLGIPITLISDVLLPGRLFPWGDYYNPFTNTVHLFSDHPGIALHEAGHVYDTARHTYKGTYAAIRLIPFVDLLQEYEATHEAVTYFERVGDRPAEAEAYKVLYPAYGTYVGQYLFPPIGTLAAVLVGHGAGRTKASAVLHQPAPTITEPGPEPSIESEPPHPSGATP